MDLIQEVDGRKIVTETDFFQALNADGTRPLQIDSSARVPD